MNALVISRYSSKLWPRSKAYDEGQERLRRKIVIKLHIIKSNYAYNSLYNLIGLKLTVKCDTKVKAFLPRAFFPAPEIRGTGIETIGLATIR